MPGEQVEVTVTLAGPALPDPSPGKTLSREELRRYGATPTRSSKSPRRYRPYGLRIEGYSELTRSLRVSGTVAQMESVFRPKLGDLPDLRRAGLPRPRGGPADPGRARRADHRRLRIRPASRRVPKGAAKRRGGGAAGQPGVPEPDRRALPVPGRDRRRSDDRDRRVRRRILPRRPGGVLRQARQRRAEGDHRRASTAPRS